MQTDGHKLPFLRIGLWRRSRGLQARCFSSSPTSSAQAPTDSTQVRVCYYVQAQLQARHIPVADASNCPHA
jgi:hypothetical protein